MRIPPRQHRAIGLGCLLAAFPSWAQNTQAPPAVPPLSTLPPSSSPVVKPPRSGELQLSRQLPPAQPASTRLQVTQVAISGVQSLPFDQVARLFEPFLNQEAALSDLLGAAAQATALYQQAGYPLSFVYLPQQSFDQGVVHVIAVEGHTSRLDITGDPGKSEALLREVLQPVLDAKPLDKATFERQTLLLARMDHLKAVASASMPATTDGAVPLQLKLERSPVLFNVGVDLRQGDSRAIGTLTLNEPLWRGSQWQFSGLLEKDSDEHFFAASTTQWLNAQGTTLRASYSDFKGLDHFAAASLQDWTRQRKLDLTVMHPWQLSTQSSTLIGASIFGLDYDKDYRYPALNLQLGNTEKVRAVQLHGIWQRSDPQSQQNANVSLTRGLDAWGAGASRNSNTTAQLIDNGARFDFTRLSFDYALRWRFQNFMGAALAVGGQVSPDRLPVSERVSFGSSRYARGYRSGEAAGDQGLGAGIELNRFFSIQDGRWIKNWEPYVKYEHARTWFHSENLPGRTLRSASLGIRLSDSRYYALDVAAAKPLGDPSPYNPEKKLRYSLTLSYQLDL